MKIILNGQNAANYGSDCTEADAQGYREWIAEELAEAFPGAEIEINEADATRSVIVEDDPVGYMIDPVNEFCADAWDRCPWNWVN